MVTSRVLACALLLAAACAHLSEAMSISAIKAHAATHAATLARERRAQLSSPPSRRTPKTPPSPAAELLQPLDDQHISRTARWSDPCGDARLSKPFEKGDIVEVKMLSKSSLGHWEGTGEWLSARIRSAPPKSDPSGSYQLERLYGGGTVRAALPSGIRRHHIRHKPCRRTAGDDDAAALGPLSKPLPGPLGGALAGPLTRRNTSGANTSRGNGSDVAKLPSADL